MSTGNKILLYAALACTVLVLAPATAAAAGTGVPVRVAVDAPPGYVTVSKSKLSLPNNTDQTGTVTCPQGTVVLSGGAYIKSTSVKAGINSSYPPSDTTWTAFANNFSGTATTFNVYAVCATMPAGYFWGSGTTVSNPAGDQDSEFISCPAGEVPFGGGANTSSRSVSVGMTSSFPVFGANPGWTAAVSNFSTSKEMFAVYEICGPFLPNYAIPSTSASDPAGVQKGIIQHCTAPAVVLGGGNGSSNTTNLRIEMKASQPFPASGTSWKSGENNDTTDSTTLTSYAICAT